MINHTETATVYTVTQLNTEVRDLLENHFATLWIVGEISNLARPSSGHLYFSLKDEQAQIRCALFKNNAQRLDFALQEGMQVLAKAKVSLYPTRGDYQLIVEYVEEMGDGLLRRAFEQLKQKLAQEKLFDPARKRTLPKFPNCIGVVTSPTGAAIRDILTVLKRRAPQIPVIIYPTAVQGQPATAQICAAITQANQHDVCDVLIIARGGGSLEDLWTFNEEAVARTIYASHIPIVSAVGHEIDFTIADFVADLRAATPSAAAEIVSPDRAELLQVLHRMEQRLVQQMTHRLQQQQQLIFHLGKRLKSPKQRLQEYMQRLDELERRLQQSMQYQLEKLRQRLAQYSHALDLVSPLTTLSRGYSIVMTKTEQVVMNTATLEIGDELKIRVQQGNLECKVTSIS